MEGDEGLPSEVIDSLLFDSKIYIFFDTLGWI